MDQNGFRAILGARQMSEEKIAAAFAIVERFEAYANQPERGLSAETAWEFSKVLIAEGANTEDNYLALALYERLTKNNPVFVAFVELLDGGEAQENLHKKVANWFGEAIRDEVFAGVGLAPLGIPTPEKPRYMHPVIQRLEDRLGAEECKKLLSGSLRDLQDEYYLDERQKYETSQDIDAYLLRKKQDFVGQLEACQHEGRLFFAQEITDKVLDFVRNDPEIGGGVRAGGIIYETKIPYMTKEYLSESDDVLKRYYYCHCPWAREAIKSSEPTTVTFCNCSAGFHKKPWEVIFGRSLEADVLESVLQGDSRCRFAIHLPMEAIPGQLGNSAAGF
jgi:hypothetical protein